MVFFDTNIFIYIVSAALADRAKKEIAERLLSESEFCLSVQILQEFMDVTLRKTQLGLTPAEISDMIRRMVAYPVLETSLALAQRAFDIKIRYGIRYWDAAIVAAALELGCHTIYSEDLSHGQDYDGVTVINPFR
jgi:predicted nucleic acid-binding protein